MADARLKAIYKYCWDDAQGFFVDYNFATQKQTGKIVGAAAFALFTGVATQKQADAMAKVMRQKLLQEGGLVATLTETGQQWDWPNGWAPLQLTAIEGLRKYGHHDLADVIKERWIACNTKIYKDQGKRG